MKIALRKKNNKKTEAAIGATIVDSALTTDLSSESAASNKKIVLYMACLGSVIGITFLTVYLTYIVPNRPENVIKRMVQRSFVDNHSSYEFDGGYKMSVSGVSFNTNIKSRFANKSSESHAEISAFLTKVTVDSKTVDGKTSYFKVGGLKGLDSLLSLVVPSSTISKNESEQIRQIAFAVNKLNDQWLVIDAAAFQDQITAMSKLGYGQNISTLDLTKQGEKLTQAVKKAISTEGLMVFDKKLDDEKIRGEDSRHYVVHLNKDEVRSAMYELKDANLESLKMITPDQWQGAIDKVSRGSTLDKYPAEIWIGKKTGYLRGFNLPISIYKDFDITLDFGFNNFDQKIDVIKPEKTKQLLEAIGEIAPMIQRIKDSSKTTSKDVERKSDVNMLAAEFEIQYNKYGYYPSKYDVSIATDDSIITKNKWYVSREVYFDPKGIEINKPGSDYEFNEDPGCKNAEGKCKHYILTARLDDGSLFTKQSLN